MSTTHKGDLFEAEVFDTISRMISEGRFFSGPEYCRAFRKKAYYSKDREREIVFDVAVEVCLPGQDTPSVLFLIECKNYSNRPVPVDDIEEFFAKVQQISPAGTKAIVASASAFQDGALRFAKSKGIGLARYFTRDSLEWVLTRSPSLLSNRQSDSSSNNAATGLRTQEFTSRCFDFYCLSNDSYTNSFSQFAERLAWDEASDELASILRRVSHEIERKPTIVPYLEESEIEDVCRSLRDAIAYKSGHIPLDEICALLTTDRGLQVKNSSLAPGILGTISFDQPLIELDAVQAGSASRVRFTLAHEIGHLCLGHGQYLHKDVCRDYDLELETPPRVDLEDIARMEWQANHFASRLILPNEQFSEAVWRQAKALGIADRGFGLIYLDDQQCNIQSYYLLTTPLMSVFKASRSMIKIRLKQLGVLNEQVPSSQLAADVVSKPQI